MTERDHHMQMTSPGTTARKERFTPTRVDDGSRPPVIEAVPAPQANAPAAPALRLPQMRPPPKVAKLRKGFTRATWAGSAPGRLDEASADWMFDAFVQICDFTFGVSFGDYWERRRSEAFLASLRHLSLVLAPDGRVAGFTTYQVRRFGGRRTIFIDSTAVLPEFQTAGLMAPIFGRNFALERCRVPFGRLYSVVRTENPVVHVALATMLGTSQLHPSPAQEIPEDVCAVASGTAEWLGQAHCFDPSVLAVRAAYPGMGALYAELPKSGVRHIDDFFAENLAPVDAFLITGSAEWRQLVPFFFKQWRKSRKLRPRS